MSVNVNDGWIRWNRDDGTDFSAWNFAGEEICTHRAVGHSVSSSLSAVVRDLPLPQQSASQRVVLPPRSRVSVCTCGIISLDNFNISTFVYYQVILAEGMSNGCFTLRRLIDA